MTSIESAWTKRPDYRIDIEPLGSVARVWFDDLLLAESHDCLVLKEQDHVARLYFPHSDVRWEHFETALDTHTVCPFKGRADYWDLVAVDPHETGIVWSYPDPFDEVGRIKEHACFYQDRTRIEVQVPGTNDPTRFLG